MDAPNLRQDAGETFLWANVLGRARRGFCPFWPYARLKDGVFEPRDRYELRNVSMFDRGPDRAQAAG
eukprot:3276893-Alexandrium_andersonii.AAC.1